MGALQQEKRIIKMIRSSQVQNIFMITTLTVSILSWSCVLKNIYLDDPHLSHGLRIVNLSKIAANDGYPMEVHHVTTTSGYTLAIHMLPQIERGHSKTVFVQHGLLASANCWFFNDDSRNLIYSLYKNGFNVALGNFRGTTQSPWHVWMSIENNDYWDFSWDELGREDLATMIDYTLNYTNQEKLFLIGYSMSTSAAFVLLSERPEYNQKIEKYLAFAPILNASHATSFLATGFSQFHKIWGVGPLVSYLVGWRFPPANTHYVEILTRGCGHVFRGDKNRGMHAACKIFWFFFGGLNTEQMDNKVLENMAQFPIERAPTKSLLHFAQGMNTKAFRKYDHGGIFNLFKYASWTPPDYNLSRVTCPVEIYWSQNDLLTDPRDMKILMEQLSKSTEVKGHEIEDPLWSHVDYILAKDSDSLLIPHVLQSIKFKS